MATAFMPFRFAGFDIGVNEQEAGIAVGTNAVVLGTMVVDKTTSKTFYSSVDGVWESVD